MVTLTLDKMAGGGIYDHLGGGFARYTVDERWLVPHFEKMLYDNALLTGGLSRSVSGHAAKRGFARVARETLRLRPARNDRRRQAAFTAPKTPTAKAKKASSTSGRPPRSKQVLGDEAGERFLLRL